MMSNSKLQISPTSMCECGLKLPRQELKVLTIKNSSIASEASLLLAFLQFLNPISFITLITGNPSQLYDSVHKQIFSLPDEYKLYPGHDYKGKISIAVTHYHSESTQYRW